MSKNEIFFFSKRFSVITKSFNYFKVFYRISYYSYFMFLFFKSLDIYYFFHFLKFFELGCFRILLRDVNCFNKFLIKNSIFFFLSFKLSLKKIFYISRNDFH